MRNLFLLNPLTFTGFSKNKPNLSIDGKRIKSLFSLSTFAFILLVLSLSFISLSCRFPPGKDVPFETIIGGSNIGGLYKEEIAQIRVISSKQSLPPERLDWVIPEYRDKVLTVDYSKYFVVMVFNGYRGGISSVFNILNIRKHDREIFVYAHFNDNDNGGSSSAFNSQYQVVKISKEQITPSRLLKKSV